jgi:type I restriction enzyme S subunit
VSCLPSSEIDDPRNDDDVEPGADHFVEFEIDLPGLDEQRAIVDTLATVEAAAAACRRESKAATNAHRILRDDIIEAADWERVELRNLVQGIKGGKSPRCHDRRPLPGEWGVLKVSAIRDGVFRPEEAKALPVDIDAFTGAVVMPGDLLYSRANTAELVGAMCRVKGEHARLLLCDKTIRVLPRIDLVDPDYLVEAVGTAGAREQIEVAAGGTSDSMRNISQAAYLDIEIALPPIARQRDIARTLGALRLVGASAQREADRLRALRDALGEEFITGARPAPRLCRGAA